MVKACLKPLIYRLWKPKIESKNGFCGTRVRMGARAVQTGQVFLVRKVILEFSLRPSGRANVSVRMDAVRTLVMAVRRLNLQNFFLAFQRRQFRPNTIFE
jgi:hypothetical protein